MKVRLTWGGDWKVHETQEDLDALLAKAEVIFGVLLFPDDLLLRAPRLDVFETEPLPADSELWNLPNVILSYHMAGFADTYGHRITGLFCENLRRYLAGEQLLNLIGNQRGY